MGVQNLCCTSIDDARGSLQFIDDIGLLRKAVSYEKKHSDRSTMIRMLTSKIRQLERLKKSHKIG